MYDSIIIGAGPAGISASLYLKRSNKKVLVLYYNESKLLKANKIDNYYGFNNGISGKELYENGIKQAINLGIEVKKEEVLEIENNNNNFVVTTDNNKYNSKTIIIASGNITKKLDIENINDYYGKGVSSCAICDGYFYKNKKLTVIGNSKYAISEANILSNITDDITILTNGLELTEETNYKVNTKKINKIIGDSVVKKIEFIDNSYLDIDGIFIATGTATSHDFALKLGILTKNNYIKVNDKYETNVENVYAIGDTIDQIHQVSTAIYSGTIAALDIINKLNNS